MRETFRVHRSDSFDVAQRLAGLARVDHENDSPRVNGKQCRSEIEIRDGMPQDEVEALRVDGGLAPRIAEIVRNQIIPIAICEAVAGEVDVDDVLGLDAPR